jgi:ABC-type antimicrobial peptide transport system permease subunit
MTAATRAVLTVAGLALATLGILGVAAVVALAEIGRGSAQAVSESIKSIDAPNLLVLPNTASPGGGGTPADAEAIAEECQPAVVGAAPVVRARTQVAYRDRTWVPLYIYGTTPDFLDVRGWHLDSGRSFTDQEAVGGGSVCLLGQTLVRELFSGESPLGRVIRVRNEPLTVIGTLEEKGANLIGMDQDDIVLAPWRKVKQLTTTTGDNLFPPESAVPAGEDQIAVRIDTESEIPGAVRDITALLRQRHRLGPDQPDDFGIRDMTEMSRALRTSTERMTWSLLGAAVLPFLLGGMGLMLLMLVSVARRAAGVRQRDVLWRFLAEAILLSLAGGTVAVLLGRVGAYLVWEFWHWPVAPSVPAALSALGASVAVGLLFGCYPAWKASRLAPIETRVGG